MANSVPPGGAEVPQENTGRGDGQTEAAKTGKHNPSLAKVLASMVPELVLIVVAVVLFAIASDFRSSPRPGQLGPDFWPQMLCVGIGIVALVRLVRKFLWRKRAAGPVAAVEGEDANLKLQTVALATALVVAYVLGIIFLGYLLSTALFLIAFVYLGRQRKWRIVVPLGMLSSVVFVYIFTKLAYLSLPTGVGVFDQFSVAVYRLLGLY